jgi:hypothetical protein
MRYGLSLLTALAWALWLGGAVTLFILVVHLFSVDRPVAVQAAPRMFVHFARYQMILAAVALLAAAAWRLTEPRAILTAIFALFAGCAVATVLIAAVITPKMEALRVRGETKTPEYGKLHGQASIAYTSEAALLLIVGLLLPGALQQRPRDERAAEDSAAPLRPEQPTTGQESAPATTSAP